MYRWKYLGDLKAHYKVLKCSISSTRPVYLRVSFWKVLGTQAIFFTVLHYSSTQHCIWLRSPSLIFKSHLKSLGHSVPLRFTMDKIRKSQNHRTVAVWKWPLEVVQSKSLHKAGWATAGHGHVQSGFKCLQGWRLHSPPRKAPVFGDFHNKKVFSHV